MSTVHMYHCINRKCKRSKQPQLRNEFKSDMRCASCKKVLKYDGEQGVLPLEAEAKPEVAHTAEVKRGLDALAYELVNAVFSVKTSYRGTRDTNGMPKEEVVTVIQPVRINNGVTRGYALPFARKHIMDYYRTSQVVFLHWADSWVSHGNAVEVR